METAVQVPPDGGSTALQVQHTNIGRAAVGLGLGGRGAGLLELRREAWASPELSAAVGLEAPLGLAQAPPAIIVLGGALSS